jgi:hypothetical protein
MKILKYIIKALNTTTSNNYVVQVHVSITNLPPAQNIEYTVSKWQVNYKKNGKNVDNICLTKELRKVKVWTATQQANNHIWVY